MKACPDCNNIQCDSMIHPTDHNLLGEEKPKKKKCKHENAICLTSMPPQWKCNDCGDIKMEFSELGKKQPTGILKELMELKRYSAEMDGCECCGQWVSTKEDKDGD